ncbi:Alpha N-terminal protein methyltransferase 1 [Vitis vinifera]|uniref:Alpha N-terminal protein methyltransferase 1 n=1 Tax=Vitis vinifera TaxID=29760 RepID=A0A438IV18_VITVI|nr:Alpha N-terminal protein methyltransferase 1 [Vitis vinifera]
MIYDDNYDELIDLILDGEIFQVMVDFTPETGRYDVIWIQWCIGQLADDDFISFFKRAKVT